MAQITFIDREISLYSLKTIENPQWSDVLYAFSMLNGLSAHEIQIVHENIWLRVLCDDTTHKFIVLKRSTYQYDSYGSRRMLVWTELYETLDLYQDSPREVNFEDAYIHRVELEMTIDRQAAMQAVRAILYGESLPDGHSWEESYIDE